MKKILFITGTRADFGKIKSLIRCVDCSEKFEAYVYVTGMHLLEQFGYTYSEVVKENYKHVYVAFGTRVTNDMSFNLGNTVSELSGYVDNVLPDMIVVHGDRTDALAGAIVGAFKNIIVAHIEGGEVSGTIDESIRHSISKLAHIHLVCNEDAKQRLIQMGENKGHIYVMGSPDIDIMMSRNLPSIAMVKERYEISFERYGLLMYHPVTTDVDNISKYIRRILAALNESKYNYVIIYPNNDSGSQIIINEYKELTGSPKYRIFPSIRFEYFLTLLKNAEFVIGNSSAGVREACIYGVPAIDIGTRQTGRYSSQLKNIQHVDHDTEDIKAAISRVDQFRIHGSDYGDGNSSQRFMSIISDSSFWDIDLQKHFVDL